MITLIRQAVAAQQTEDNSNSNQAAPFLRWAGSKRWLIAHLKTLVPPSYGTYYEPFLGSGAVFFSLVDKEHPAKLSDTIPGLISCFQQVRRSPQEVARHALHWGTDAESYYTVRSAAGSGSATVEAARFIYLNKLCFNGLYRENRSGWFNVPYGRPKPGDVTSKFALTVASKRLQQNVTLRVQDFSQALATCLPRDFVYLDPPYVAGHRSNGFVDYNSKIFNWHDQERLADTFRSLDEAGVYVVLSNADHDSIRDLYVDYEQVAVSRFSSMASNKTRRGQSTELLIVGKALSGAPR